MTYLYCISRTKFILCDFLLRYPYSKTIKSLYSNYADCVVLKDDKMNETKSVQSIFWYLATTRKERRDLPVVIYLTPSH